MPAGPWLGAVPEGDRWLPGTPSGAKTLWAASCTGPGSACVYAATAIPAMTTAAAAAMAASRVGSQRGQRPG